MRAKTAVVAHPGLDGPVHHPAGVVTESETQLTTRTLLEGATGAGESPVGESQWARPGIREYGGTRVIPSEAGGTTLQG